MLYKILQVNFNSAHFFSFWLSSLLWIPFWNSECYTKSFRWISILHISFLFGFQAFFEFPSEILNIIQNPSGEFQFCTFLFFLAFKPSLNSLLKFWMLYKILQVNFNSAHFFSFWLSSNSFFEFPSFFLAFKPSLNSLLKFWMLYKILQVNFNSAHFFSFWLSSLLWIPFWNSECYTKSFRWISILHISFLFGFQAFFEFPSEILNVIQNPSGEFQFCTFLFFLAFKPSLNSLLKFWMLYEILQVDFNSAHFFSFWLSRLSSLLWIPFWNSECYTKSFRWISILHISFLFGFQAFFEFPSEILNVIQNPSGEFQFCTFLFFLAFKPSLNSWNSEFIQNPSGEFQFCIFFSFWLSNSAHFFSFWLSSLLWIPFWNSECYTKSFRWISILHISFLFGFQAFFEFPSEILNVIQNPSGEFQFCTFLFFLAFKPSLNSLLKFWILYKILQVNFNSAHFFSFWLSSLLWIPFWNSECYTKSFRWISILHISFLFGFQASFEFPSEFWMLYKILQVNFNSAHFFSFGLSSLLWIPFWNSECYTKSFRWISILHISFLFGFQAFFEFPSEILNIIQNPSGEFKFCTFLFFLKPSFEFPSEILNLYKILQVNFNSAHFFSFWLSSLLWIPFWNSEYYTKSFRWISILHFSFLFGFQAFFEFPSEILNIIQNPSGEFQFCTFLFFLAFKPSLNSLLKFWIPFWNSECYTKSFRWISILHISFLFFLAFKPSLNSLLKFWMLYKILQVNFNSAHFFSFWLSSLLWIPFWNSECYTKSFRWISILHISFLFGFQAFFEFPSEILNIIQNPSGEFQFCTFLFFLAFKPSLNSLLKFWILYKILQVNFNSAHFFSFWLSSLLWIPFEFPSEILNFFSFWLSSLLIQNPSGEFQFCTFLFFLAFKPPLNSLLKFWMLYKILQVNFNSAHFFSFWLSSLLWIPFWNSECYTKSFRWISILHISFLFGFQAFFEFPSEILNVIQNPSGEFQFCTFLFFLAFKPSLNSLLKFWMLYKILQVEFKFCTFLFFLAFKPSLNSLLKFWILYKILQVNFNSAHFFSFWLSSLLWIPFWNSECYTKSFRWISILHISFLLSSLLWIPFWNFKISGEFQFCTFLFFLAFKPSLNSLLKFWILYKILQVNFNSAHFFSFWLSSLLWIPFWNSECYTKSFRWISILHISFLFGFQAFFEFPSEILNVIQNPSGEFQFCTFLFFLAFKPSLNSLLKFWMLYKILQVNFNSAHFFSFWLSSLLWIPFWNSECYTKSFRWISILHISFLFGFQAFFEFPSEILNVIRKSFRWISILHILAFFSFVIQNPSFKPFKPLNSLLKFWMLYKILQVNFNSAHFFSFWLSSLLWIPFWNSECYYTKSFRWISILQFCTFLFFLAFKPSLNSLLKFWILYKILQVNFNSAHFFSFWLSSLLWIPFWNSEYYTKSFRWISILHISFLFGFQAFFEFPSEILNIIQNPSGEFQFCTFLFFWAFKPLWIPFWNSESLYKILQVNFNSAHFLFFLAFKPSLNSLLKFWILYKILQVNFNSAHFFSFWLSSFLAFKPSLNSLLKSLLNSEIIQNPSGEFQFCTFLFFLAFKPSLNSLLKFWMLYKILQVNFNSAHFFFLAFKPSLNSLLKFWMLYKILQVNFNSAHFFSFWLSSLLWIPFWNSEYYTKSFRWISILHISFLFGFQAFFEFPSEILNIIQNPSGEFQFCTFLFFLAFKPSLNSLLKFWMLYKILQVNFNSAHFFSFWLSSLIPFWNSECYTKSFRWISILHFSFWLSSLLWIPFWNSEYYTKSFRWFKFCKAFFEFPSEILNIIQNPSGEFQFCTFLFFLAFKPSLNSLLKFCMLYKIFFLHISFLFGFQAFFEFPSEILNVIQNPSGEFQFCTFLFFLAFKPSLNSLLKFWMLYKILQVNFNSAHFFSFWLSSLLWIPFWNSEYYTKSFRWISILHISFLFGFQAFFEFPSEILNIIQNPSGEFQFCTFLFFLAFKPPLNSLLKFWMLYKILQVNFQFCTFLFFWAFKPSLNSLLKFWMLYKILQVNFNSAHFFSFWLSSLLWIPFWNSECYTKSFRWISILHISFLFGFQAFFEFPSEILNVIQNPSGEFQFCTFLFFLAFKPSLNSLLKFWILYKILQVNFNSALFFSFWLSSLLWIPFWNSEYYTKSFRWISILHISFLFGFQAFFEFPSEILNVIQNPSGEFQFCTFLFFLAFKPSLNSLLKFWMLYKILQVNFNSAHFFSFWLSSLLWIPFWNSECYTKSFRWISILHISFLFGFQAFFEFPSEILNVIQNPSGEFQFCTFLFFLAFKPPLNSLLKFWMLYKILQVDLNSAHFFSFWLSSLFWIPFWNSECYTKSFRWISILHISFLFGFQAFFEFPSEILNIIQNPSGEFQFCTFLFFLAFKPSLNSLLKFWMLYKILQVNFNSAHFFSFWLSSLLWIPFWNSECYTKSFRWISILHFSFLFGFQAFFEFPSEILNIIQNPSGEFQFCTFLFFLAFKPSLNSLLKFWMLYKILQVNFNSAHFFSFWLSSLLWIPFWNSEYYTKSFRWISILHISFLFGFQAFFEFPSEILNIIQNPSGEFQFCTFLFFLAFKPPLNSLLKFWMLYKILQVNFNSAHFFSFGLSSLLWIPFWNSECYTKSFRWISILHISFLFGFQAFFEFPSEILNIIQNPSGGFKFCTFLFFLAFKPSLNSLLKFWILYKILQVNFNSAHFFSFWLSSLLWIPFWNSEYYTKSFRWISILHFSFLFGFQAFFEFPSEILNIIQNPSGEFQFCTFLFFLAFKPSLNSLLKFWMLYKILQVNFNSAHFFSFWLSSLLWIPFWNSECYTKSFRWISILHISFLFGFQAFFEFPSEILNVIRNPSGGFQFCTFLFFLAFKPSLNSLLKFWMLYKILQVNFNSAHFFSFWLSSLLWIPFWNSECYTKSFRWI